MECILASAMSVVVKLSVVEAAYHVLGILMHKNRAFAYASIRRTLDTDKIGRIHSIQNDCQVAMLRMVFGYEYIRIAAD